MNVYFIKHESEPGEQGERFFFFLRNVKMFHLLYFCGNVTLSQNCSISRERSECSPNEQSKSQGHIFYACRDFNAVFFESLIQTRGRERRSSL